ncbi:MAG: hypothetical protein F4X13_00230 [Gammaproteobacteria bacterium]|nr:hypothetical protein [Gammaproteobacteria bacterium]
MTPSRADGARRLLEGGLLCLLFACGGDQAPGATGTISRDVFVDTYVELRMTALHSPDGRVSPEAKAEILESNGVTEADLLQYVDIHGARLQFMVEVWAEIDDTLRALRTENDPAPAS